MHITDVTEHMTPNEFADEFHLALAGETFCYARGRLSESLCKGVGLPCYLELRTVHDLALCLAEEGRALLTQRRIGSVPYDPRECGTFEYLCTKRTAKQRGSMSQWPIPISSKSKSPRTESSDSPR